jgi:pilus assembly protein Flp/PilA
VGEQETTTMKSTPAARFSSTASRLLRDRRGVTAIEYGLIAAMIAVAIIGILGALGAQLKATFQSVNSAL